MRKTADKARDKWPGILAALGMPSEALNGKHQPCPCTGDGTDRFRFADKGRGAFYCHCVDGQGDGLELVQCLKSCGFREAAQMVDEVLGDDIKPTPQTDKPDPRIKLRKVYGMSYPVGLVVRRYLKSRKLAASPVMREISYGETFGMVCRIYDDQGPLSLHVTYLDRQSNPVEFCGTKKRVLPPLRPMSGNYWIPLADQGRHLYIAEGIETAMSSVPLFGATAVYATVSTHGMKTFRLPREFDRVTILADRDENYAGQAAAYALAERLSRDTEPNVIVSEGNDFNDDLRATA